MAPLLIVYFPLADPAFPLELIDAYVEARVAIVECGWPARNPYLDGSEVRASMARALGRDPSAALADVRARLCRYSVPPKLLVMTYAEPDHPALAPGRGLAAADALLAIGRPSSPERRMLEETAQRAGLRLATFLPLPVAEEDVAAACSDVVYAMLQAATGVTGARASLDPANGQRVADLRRRGVSAPIALGFGISSGSQARAALKLGADGVVVGSAALRAGLNGRADLTALLEDLRRGLDA